MKTDQCLDAFDEVYEVVCTRIVCVNERMFRLEVRECLKGNLKRKYDCCYYEDDECVNRENPKDAPMSFCRRTTMPGVYCDSANDAMKRALGWITEKLSSGLK